MTRPWGKTWDQPEVLIGELVAHSKIDRRSGCWLWTYTYDSDGYGRMRVNNKTIGVHRVSAVLFLGWEWAREFVRTNNHGLRVCHTCDVPACFNPDHLFAGTQRDNLNDCVRKDRHFWSKRDRCSRGHVYAEVGFYVTGNGTRNCLACHRYWNEIKRGRRKLSDAK